jgi:hypothetical protein
MLYAIGCGAVHRSSARSAAKPGDFLFVIAKISSDFSIAAPDLLGRP